MGPATLYYLVKAWMPGWNRTDNYADFFQDVYFGDRKLDGLKNPYLGINTTCFQDQERRVYASLGKPRPTDKNMTSPQTDARLIKNLVAASGAFPVAFRSKLLNAADCPGR